MVPFAASLSASPIVIHALPQAAAGAVIARAAVANSREWAQSPRYSRRELVVKDERGQPIHLRLIDHE